MTMVVVVAVVDAPTAAAAAAAAIVLPQTHTLRALQIYLLTFILNPLSEEEKKLSFARLVKVTCRSTLTTLSTA